MDAVVVVPLRSLLCATRFQCVCVCVLLSTSAENEQSKTRERERESFLHANVANKVGSAVFSIRREKERAGARARERETINKK